MGMVTVVFSTPTAGNSDAARGNQWLTAWGWFIDDDTAERVADAAVGMVAAINADTDDPAHAHGFAFVARSGNGVGISVRNRRTARATASGVAWATLGNAVAAAIPAGEIAESVAMVATESDTEIRSYLSALGVAD